MPRRKQNIFKKQVFPRVPEVGRMQGDDAPPPPPPDKKCMYYCRLLLGLLASCILLLGISMQVLPHLGAGSRIQACLPLPPGGKAGAAP
jgi:hypothetical protein